MSKEVTFKLNLKVDGKDVVKQLTVDMNELEKVINKTNNTSDKLRDSLIKFNQGVEMVRNISDSFSQLSGTLNSLTEESRSFGGAMAAANTMAGKSGEDFAKLKDQVAELSHAIPIARDELANGLYQVISNGVPEDNWIEFLNKSARASVGGIADLGETVKVTSTIIKNYGLRWSDAGSIQDKIQLTAKNGVTSFEQLAQALPRVTSQAATLGVSVDELMATFSTLTGVSGNTAEVSTQLAAIFTALIKPSSEAAEMAQQMGIQFDAAAIKAAGGMEQFLVSLDKSVKQYSASSGVLEQEVYGKLFGSAESLRALTPLTGKLAEKFRENVADMKDSAGAIDDAFDIVVSTGKAKLQMLNNKFGEFTDFIQLSVGNMLPYLNFGSQLTITISSMAQLTVAMKSLAVTTRLVTAATNAAARAKVAAAAIAKVLAAAYNGEAVGATTAAVATRALGAAVKGLLISTGVGIAIWLLVEVIGQLTSSSDEAADKVDDLTEAEQRAKQAHQQTAQEIAGVRSEMDLNILKLKNFKGSKEEEKKLVGEMNTKYGEAMGYYSTVAQWYTALTKNSKMYCDQMINEITLRKLANEAAELRQQQHDILKDENGKTRTYSTKRRIKEIKHVSGSDPNAPDVDIEYREEVGSSELEKAQAKYNEARRKEKAIRKRMQTIVEKSASYVHTEGYSATPPSGTGGRAGSGGTTNHTPTVTNQEDDPQKGSIDWYTKVIDEKKRQLSATANEATAKSLNNEVEALQRDLYFLKVRIGVEVPPPIEVKKAIKPMAEQIQESFDDMQKYLKEHPLQVQADPKRLEKLTQKMKDFEKIKGLGNIDLGNFESVEKAMTDIQGIANPTAQGFAAAGTACQALGGAMQQLGGDSAAAKAGLVMAAIGQLALSLATAMTSAAKQSWITWLAFGISGTAQLVSMVATISQFATGGIVGGNSKSGDRVLARVNSGEMILNAAQQAQLFAIANGRMQPTVNTDVLAGLMAGGAGGVKAGSVVGKIRGRDIVLVTANETRQMRRRSNIKI
jgi:TP901 family phage tail tape measure protein|nr:MAG TPA: minor tail protein [Caudoviricetes sp.]